MSPFGRALGRVEAALDRELQRRWLIWRDEVIRSGETAAAKVRALLVERQRDWEATVHEALDGLTPIETVEAERADAATGG